VTSATMRCGVTTNLEDPNRLVSEEGKVGGMAAYISKRGLLCHGTLLLSADLTEAKRLTDPATARLESRYTRSNAMLMANTGIESHSFIAGMKAAVAEKTGLKVELDVPNAEERDALSRLLPKYTDPRWNLGDPFEW